MHLRLLTTPVLAIGLLFSTLACSKKDDPAAASVGTGSYKLDGTTITCQAKAYPSSATSGGLTYDYLEIDLTTTPQPASGTETLKLFFFKQGGQPSNAYQLNDFALFTKGNTTSPYYFANDVTTLTATNGGFSGTFSAKASSPAGGTAPGPYTSITAGVFTDARP
jgi:hypothetical protein